MRCSQPDLPPHTQYRTCCGYCGFPNWMAVGRCWILNRRHGVCVIRESCRPNLLAGANDGYGDVILGPGVGQFLSS
jgi:hypothetical protein